MLALELVEGTDIEQKSQDGMEDRVALPVFAEESKAEAEAEGNSQMLHEKMLEKKGLRCWNRLGRRVEHLKGEEKMDLK